MDKLKVQAEQVASKAQQGVAQGQSKIGEMQAKRAADSLLHDLGAAVYAAQRQGGPHEPIETIMSALDAHAAAHGGVDTATAPADAAAPPAPASADGSPAPAAPSSGPSTPTGDFTMDDL